ncbi:MAG: hypothetical protein GX640_06280 [Fibrobacter sp.]|nr:hypothetical protein [Fibrobacter sp.]
MNDQTEDNRVITCYYVSNNNSNTPKNIFTLNESPQTIEFTDEIGEKFGNSTRLEARTIENGKVILLKVETSDSVNDSSSTTTNTTTHLHYIDSSLLPRKIPVKGLLIDGFVVIENSDIDSSGSNNKRGCSGYYFFIQERLEELRRANKPYTGTNASADFVKEWNALSRKKKEKYNLEATSK